MRVQWIAPALLSTALLVGCGDRNAQQSANSDPNAAPAGTATPQDTDQARREAVSPDDDAAIGPDSSGARPTTGARPSASAARPRPAAPPASSRTDSALDRRDDDRTRADRAANEPRNAAPRVEYREVKVPAGTALPLELTTALASNTSSVETPVHARVKQAVVVDGYTAIPAGSVLTGHVTEVDDAGRVRGRAHLSFTFTEAQINGAREDVRTNPLTFQAEATKGEDATKVGAGAGIGAVIGGIVGGGKGAAKGAAIGGAAGTGAVLATKGKEVTLPAGTDLAATLADAFTVRVRER